MISAFSSSRHRNFKNRRSPLAADFLGPACGYGLSTDPFLVEKVRDIVGLYPNPPNNADAKTCRDAEGSISRARLGVWLVEGGIKRPWDFRRGRRRGVANGDAEVD